MHGWFVVVCILTKLTTTEITRWERSTPSTFKSVAFSSQISPTAVCTIVQLLLLKHFYSACLWRSLDSCYNKVLGSQYFSKEVLKKNRVLKVFSGKSLDFSFFVICQPKRFDVTKHHVLKWVAWVELLSLACN